jgi:GNAT superfamily N-acetyltransferase
MPNDRPYSEDDVRFVPANQVDCHQLLAVFGTADYASRCLCQRFKTTGWIWNETTVEQRAAMLTGDAHCGVPGAPTTNGLVAFVDDQPAGWVAVEPRINYPKLRVNRLTWTGRPSERKDDPDIWSITCLIVRKGFRGRGLTYLLARAAVDYAQSRGALAVEAYPMEVEPGYTVTWGELYVGARQVFDDAGFVQVSAPSKRRRVMSRRLD